MSPGAVGTCESLFDGSSINALQPSHATPAPDPVLSRSLDILEARCNPYDRCKMQEVAKSREASWKTPDRSNRLPNTRNSRSPLTFQQWLARRRLPVDVQFLLFFIFTHVVYGYKASQKLSLRSSDPSNLKYERIVRWLDLPGPQCSTEGGLKLADLLLRAPVVQQLLHYVANFIKVRRVICVCGPPASYWATLTHCSAHGELFKMDPLLLWSLHFCCWRLGCRVITLLQSSYTNCSSDQH